MFFRAIVWFGLVAISGGVSAQTAPVEPQQGQARADSRDQRPGLRATLQAQREVQRPASRVPDGPQQRAVREMSPQERAALRQQLRQQRGQSSAKPPQH